MRRVYNFDPILTSSTEGRHSASPQRSVEQQVHCAAEEASCRIENVSRLVDYRILQFSFLVSGAQLPGTGRAWRLTYRGLNSFCGPCRLTIVTDNVMIRLPIITNNVMGRLRLWAVEIDNNNAMDRLRIP